MKKTIFLLLSVALIVFTSCNKEDELVIPQEELQIENESQGGLKSVSGYNGATAASYALEYTEECWDIPNNDWLPCAFSDNSYNPYYKDWTNTDSDCANFVSQCLKAGGMPYVSTSNPPVSNYKNWWYDNNGTYGYTTSDDNCSHSWNNAAALYTFLYIKYRPTKTAITSYSSYSSLIQGIKKGDVVFEDKGNNGIEHVYIVTDVIGSDIRVCAHTGNREDAQLEFIVQYAPGSWKYTAMKF